MSAATQPKYTPPDSHFLAITRLREVLVPGTTVYSIVRRVSKSGMSCNIDLYVIRNGHPAYITDHVNDVINPRSKASTDNGIRVTGCGMDVCWRTVYTLGRYLYPNGFGLAPCENPDGIRLLDGPRPETPDEAEHMVKQGWKFRGRHGDTSGWDNDGGYALESRIL